MLIFYLDLIIGWCIYFMSKIWMLLSVGDIEMFINVKSVGYVLNYKVILVFYGWLWIVWGGIVLLFWVEDVLFWGCEFLLWWFVVWWICWYVVMNYWLCLIVCGKINFVLEVFVWVKLNFFEDVVMMVFSLMG